VPLAGAVLSSLIFSDRPSFSNRFLRLAVLVTVIFLRFALALVFTNIIARNNGRAGLMFLAVLFTAPVAAEWRSSKPIEFVATAGPGGGTDNLARAV
jgi:hypothetical protein